MGQLFAAGANIAQFALWLTQSGFWVQRSTGPRRYD